MIEMPPGHTDTRQVHVEHRHQLRVLKARQVIARRDVVVEQQDVLSFVEQLLHYGTRIRKVDHNDFPSGHVWRFPVMQGRAKLDIVRADSFAHNPRRAETIRAVGMVNTQLLHD